MALLHFLTEKDLLDLIIIPKGLYLPYY